MFTILSKYGLDTSAVDLKDIVQYVDGLNNSQKHEMLYNVHTGCNTLVMSIEKEIKVSGIYRESRNEEKEVSVKTSETKNRNTLVINAFGGAGAGKSTACMKIVYELKKRGYLADYVNEYAKELVYEKRFDLLDGTEEHQRFILEEQQKRVSRLIGEVDFVVTDSPVLLNGIYCKNCTSEYWQEIFNLYEANKNFNLYITRDASKFEQEGRIHTLEESIAVDNQIIKMLKDNNLYYGTYDHGSVIKVVDNAVKTYEKYFGPPERLIQSLPEVNNQSYNSNKKAPHISQKDKTSVLIKQAEDGIREVFDSQRYKQFLQTMSVFHNYSVRNTLLIMLQKPEASKVAGFETWKKLGRYVNRGEKAIKIIAYTPKEISKKIEVKDDEGHSVLDSEGNKKYAVVTKIVPSYSQVNVFDISQTSGEPLPNLTQKLSADVKDFDQKLDALKMISKLEIKFIPENQMPGEANGYCSYSGNYIAVKENMSESQTLKTTIHEIVHSRLHTPKSDRQTAEIEAESIAYVVCEHLGIDSSDYSFPYVAGWSQDKDLEILENSLHKIHKEANILISDFDNAIKEVLQEKDKSLNITEKRPMKEVIHQAKEKANAINNGNYARRQQELAENYIKHNRKGAEKNVVK